MTGYDHPAGTTLEQVLSQASVILVRAALLTPRAKWLLPDQTRPHYTLWLIARGRLTVTIGVQQFEAAPGTVVLIPPHVPHRASHQDRGEPLQCYALEWTIRLDDVAAPGVLTALPPILRPRPPAWDTLVESAVLVCREFAAKDPAHALIANSTVARMIGVLWREAAETGTLGAAPAGRGDGDATLVRVLVYIGRHIAEPLTLAGLARIAHLSPAHFSTTFRRATGLSPFQYLRRYRLQRAKELLAESNLPVAQVASAVGLPDAAYFSRVFRRAEGLSPRRYRAAKQSPTTS